MGKIQKKSKSEWSYTFVFYCWRPLRTAFDTQCVRRCSNVYFYALFIFLMRFKRFSMHNYAFTRLICNSGDQNLWYHQKAVFAKVFRFLPDIRSGKQIFFTSPNKNLPDRIKRADLVKKKKKQTKTNNRIIIIFTVLYQKQYTLTSLKFNLCYIWKFKQKCPVLIFNHNFSPLFPFDTELLCWSVGIIIFFLLSFLESFNNMTKA